MSKKIGEDKIHEFQTRFPSSSKRKYPNGDIIPESDGGDPECSSEEEIDKYLRYKNIALKVIEPVS